MIYDTAPLYKSKFVRCQTNLRCAVESLAHLSKQQAEEPRQLECFTPRSKSVVRLETVPPQGTYFRQELLYSVGK